MAAWHGSRIMEELFQYKTCKIDDDGSWRISEWTVYSTSMNQPANNLMRILRWGDGGWIKDLMADLALEGTLGKIDAKHKPTNW